jgi:hypothetical protein
MVSAVDTAVLFARGWDQLPSLQKGKKCEDRRASCVQPQPQHAEKMTGNASQCPIL